MELWGWCCLGGAALAVLALFLRLCALRSAADELRRGLAERADAETNTLLDLSCRDRHMRALAAELNVRLRQLRAQRQRYERGEAELTEAVTNAAHDLRTPLTAITGYLQLLRREPVSETARRYLALAEDRAEAMGELTRELFGYSVTVSRRELSAEPVILNDVLAESLAAAYGALTAKNIEPALAVCEKKVERLLDRSALSRVFGNILSNAVKYSGGDLRVSLDEAGTAVFENLAPGLDAVSVGRLFDRFYTVESGRGSTGLGLSIAKLLTERMGGCVVAELREGRLFITLSFPA